jgi:hypothetical protein
VRGGDGRLRNVSFNVSWFFCGFHATLLVYNMDWDVDFWI